MAAKVDPTAQSKRNSLDLFSDGRLEVHVPDLADSTINPRNDPEELMHAPSRTSVFYDEKLPVCVRVHIPFAEVPDMTPLRFRGYLTRFAISLEVSAASFANARYSSLGFQLQQTGKVQELQETSHPIFSTIIDQSSLIYVSCVNQKSNQSSHENQGWEAIWLVELPIVRPRARLISPRISIAAQASLRAKALEGGSISLWTPPSASDDDSDPETSILTEEQVTDEYLIPLAPLTSMNLLEGLSHDVKFSRLSTPPTLPVTKVLSPASRVTPLAGAALTPEVVKLAHLASKVYIPVFPCVTMRLRCSRLPNSATLSEDGNVVLANLDIDVTAYAKVDVVLRSVEFVVVGGKVDHLQFPTGKYPIRCKPLDGISEIFRLMSLTTQPATSGGVSSSKRGSGISQNEALTSKHDMVRSVTIKVEYTPVLRPKQDTSSEKLALEDVNSMGPLISTTWNTSVDFSAESPGASNSLQSYADQNRAMTMQQDAGRQQSYGGLRSVSGRSSSAWLQMQQLRSPSVGSLPAGDVSPMLGSGSWSLPTQPAAAHMNPYGASASPQMPSHPLLSPQASQSTLSVPQPHQHTQQQQSQQLAYSAALRQISHEGLNITFTGPTQVIAGEIFTWKVFISNRSRSSKRIALIVQPKKWKVNNTKTLPRDPPQRMHSSQHQGLNAATIVADDAALHVMHMSGKIEADELVSLVNDIRVGPLGPGAIHETEIRLVALGVGVLSLDGVRVVDLAKGAGFECTNLMNVISRRE
ncbi:TRAPP trafficking subunit Trs65-domain-containing protein [Myxozyma melibiosi]|uniref:TRAPP trafficking subunit Trs65-domain-containing protein n=1 Tax=Myxozyma melibiosi TaxID=54550 RepID=A0ABR1F7Z7_9ASCO